MLILQRDVDIFNKIWLNSKNRAQTTKHIGMWSWPAMAPAHVLWLDSEIIQLKWVQHFHVERITITPNFSMYDFFFRALTNKLGTGNTECGRHAPLHTITWVSSRLFVYNRAAVCLWNWIKRWLLNFNCGLYWVYRGSNFVDNSILQ